MRSLMQWVLAATLFICGASVFTACTSDDDNLGTGEYDRAKKALLIILDGWGNGDKSKDFQRSDRYAGKLFFDSDVL